MNLEQLQTEVEEWSIRNFTTPRGLEGACDKTLGVAEEVGELCHSLLKMKQGIRTNEDHRTKGKDAVGDIIVYLADTCACMGWSLEECVDMAWGEVKERDWTHERPKVV